MISSRETDARLSALTRRSGWFASGGRVDADFGGGTVSIKAIFVFDANREELKAHARAAPTIPPPTMTTSYSSVLFEDEASLDSDDASADVDADVDAEENRR